jgi:hypothetical protein
MKKKQKVNPRRRPATWADVDRARHDGVRLAMVLFLFVLVDKHGKSKDEIHRIWQNIVYQAEAIKEKRTTFDDLASVLISEYELNVRGDIV